jgi:carbamoyl-phosphate synthase large subunit
MAKTSNKSSRGLNIMFTCIGRRVSLLNSFRKSAKELKIKAIFIGTDTTELSSAFQLCDRHLLVKPTNDPNYLKQILGIVKKHSVKLLVPTVDLDLKLFADNKGKFEKLGCCVLISPPEVIEICQDKRKTYKFLKKNGFDTPETMSSKVAIGKKGLKYPCFLKPWDGYASRGTAVVRNKRELAFYTKQIPNCIVQEFASGSEYTCDVFVDFDMEVRCVVPRERLEVRSGEVSKGRVAKDMLIMESAAEVVRALGAGPGVITLQLIADGDGTIKTIEINPRFGGGAPLAIEAGANFPKWILQLLVGKKPRIQFDGFKDGLTMLRYDAEVWV